MDMKTIITRLKNGIAAYKGTAYFHKSLDFLNEDKYREAEIAFEQAESIVPFLFIERRVLKGVIKFFREDYEGSMEVFEGVWGDIDLIKRYSEDDKIYLKKYIHNIIKFPKYGAVSDSFSSVDYDKIHLNKVSKKLKKSCPLAKHPEWVDPW